jgi:hypothetical protein
VNSPPPKPEVILTNFFAEPTVLLVPITSREVIISKILNFQFIQTFLQSYQKMTKIIANTDFYVLFITSKFVKV